MRNRRPLGKFDFDGVVGLEGVCVKVRQAGDLGDLGVGGFCAEPTTSSFPLFSVVGIVCVIGVVLIVFRILFKVSGTVGGGCP